LKNNIKETKMSEENIGLYLNLEKEEIWILKDTKKEMNKIIFFPSFKQVENSIRFAGYVSEKILSRWEKVNE
jgi:hypothetical protein